LYFIGLVQPIGAIMPVAEIQSHWVADLLQGRATLPPEPEMNREIASYRTATANRYARHGIQVDFLPYLTEIMKERVAGARRHQAHQSPGQQRRREVRQVPRLRYGLMAFRVPSTTAGRLAARDLPVPSLFRQSVKGHRT